VGDISSCIDTYSAYDDTITTTTTTTTTTTYYYYIHSPVAGIHGHPPLPQQLVALQN